MRIRSGLTVLLISAGIAGALASLEAQSQAIDASACEQACSEEHASCVSACGDHEDPVECEEQCRDRLEDCRMQCR